MSKIIYEHNDPKVIYKPLAYVVDRWEYFTVFDNMDKFFEHYKSGTLQENEADIAARPEFLYGTIEHSLYLDAESILETACEHQCENNELDEECMEYIGEDGIYEFQVLLNVWCNSMREKTKTYRYDDNVLIRIPWDLYRR
jgi:hypothetical protein